MVCYISTYVIPGDRCQLYEWELYGLRLHIPKGIVKENESCENNHCSCRGSVRVSPGADPTSVVYIEVSRVLDKEFTMELQHCVTLNSEKSLKTMTFGFAPYLLNEEHGSLFKYVGSGNFQVNRRYGSFKVARTGSYCIFLKYHTRSTYMSMCVYYPSMGADLKWQWNNILLL